MAVEPAKNGGVDADAAAAQRAAVSADYAKVVNQTGGCCVTSTTNRSAIGYSDADLAKVGGADLGVGCGTPVRLARLAPGETVLDLGCGAGIDCFLAADDVGAAGAVVGVDMTPDMLARAREGGREKGLVPPRVEFRLGEIENLPAGDNTVDAVISNCVINLSPDKPRVLREALRVLKPGGTAALSKHAAKENVQKKVLHPNPLARVSALHLSWVFFFPVFFFPAWRTVGAIRPLRAAPIRSRISYTSETNAIQRESTRVNASPPKPTQTNERSRHDHSLRVLFFTIIKKDF